MIFINVRDYISFYVDVKYFALCYMIKSFSRIDKHPKMTKKKFATNVDRGQCSLTLLTIKSHLSELCKMKLFSYKK